MSLMLHAGANAVDYEGLRALVTPEATATHVPIPHFRVVDLMKSTLSMYGHEVVSEHYGVTEDGARFFGTFSDGTTFKGRMRNEIGRGYSALDGYGFINAERAVNTVLKP